MADPVLMRIGLNMVKRPKRGTMADHEHPVERHLAGSLLTEVAGRSSANIDSFSTWLFLGYSAAVTFLLANSTVVGTMLTAGWLPSCLKVLVVLAVLLLAQKSLALIVAGGAAGAAVGRELSAPIIGSGIELQLEVFLGEIEKATFWPVSILVKRSFAKVIAGDLAASGRAMFRIGQIQALVAGLQMIIIICQLYRVAHSVVF
jgi:hypothetical protein